MLKKVFGGEKNPKTPPNKPQLNPSPFHKKELKIILLQAVLGSFAVQEGGRVKKTSNTREWDPKASLIWVPAEFSQSA